MPWVEDLLHVYHLPVSARHGRLVMEACCQDEARVAAISACPLESTRTCRGLGESKHGGSWTRPVVACWGVGHGFLWFQQGVIHQGGCSVWIIHSLSPVIGRCVITVQACSLKVWNSNTDNNPRCMPRVKDVYFLAASLHLVWERERERESTNGRSARVKNSS